MNRKVFTGLQQGPFGKFSLMLVALIALVVFYPSADGHPFETLILLMLGAFTLIGGLWAVADRRSTLIVGVALGIPCFLFNSTPVLGHHSFHALSGLFSVSFYLYITVHLINNVLRAPRVTTDIIAGSIAIYLLLGITWAVFYTAIDSFLPGSFTATAPLGNKESSAFAHADFIYFSFCTISTLGYGDIVPVRPLARSFAFLEAMTGVIYIAVFVGRIVSLHKPLGQATHHSKTP